MTAPKRSFSAALLAALGALAIAALVAAEGLGLREDAAFLTGTLGGAQALEGAVYVLLWMVAIVLAPIALGAAALLALGDLVAARRARAAGKSRA